MEWRQGREGRNPRNQLSPIMGADGSVTFENGLDPASVIADCRFRSQRREEEEAAALHEKLRIEKRERRKKKLREKKDRGEKKRRQKKELRGLRRSAASSSGATGVEASEVTSNEVGPTRLETLSLTDSSSALDSTFGDIGSGLPDSSVMAPLTDEALSPSDLSDSTITAPCEEALSPRSKEEQKFEEYSNQPTFDNFEDALAYLCKSERADRAKAQAMCQQTSLVLEPDQAQLVLTPEAALPVGAQGQKGSKEEIAQNGKKWMTEEVMVAFQKYRKRKDDLKDLDYEFDDLQHQCFNVETYDKIFHHFNFTVKMKESGLSDWISVSYFAEVKEIFGHKIYYCSPLEPNENGHCYACKNQGMDDLKHPIVGAFDRGNPDSISPFMCGDDSSDDEDYDFL